MISDKYPLESRYALNLFLFVRSEMLEHLRPRTNNAHAKRPQKHKYTSINPPPSIENAPTLIAKEVLRHQFDKRSENQQSSRDCIHDAD